MACCNPISNWYDTRSPITSARLPFQCLEAASLNGGRASSFPTLISPNDMALIGMFSVAIEARRCPSKSRACQRLGRKRSDTPVAGGRLLIDAGIGPRTLAERLDGTGAARPTSLRSALPSRRRPLFGLLGPTLRRLNIQIYCHADEVDALASGTPDLAPLIRPFNVNAFSPIEGLLAARSISPMTSSARAVSWSTGSALASATLPTSAMFPSYFFDRFETWTALR